MLLDLPDECVVMVLVASGPSSIVLARVMLVCRRLHALAGDETTLWWRSLEMDTGIGASAWQGVLRGGGPGPRALARQFFTADVVAQGTRLSSSHSNFGCPVDLRCRRGFSVEMALHRVATNARLAAAVLDRVIDHGHAAVGIWVATAVDAVPSARFRGRLSEGLSSELGNGRPDNSDGQHPTHANPGDDISCTAAQATGNLDDEGIPWWWTRFAGRVVLGGEAVRALHVCAVVYESPCALATDAPRIEFVTPPPIGDNLVSSIELVALERTEGAVLACRLCGRVDGVKWRLCVVRGLHDCRWTCHCARCVPVSWA